MHAAADAVGATADAPQPADSVLHLLLSAASAAVGDCGACVVTGDAIVLLGSGVLAPLDESGWPRLSAGIDVLFLESDAMAQGIAAALPRKGLQACSERDLVELISRYRHCLSWK